MKENRIKIILLFLIFIQITIFVFCKSNTNCDKILGSPNSNNCLNNKQNLTAYYTQNNKLQFFIKDTQEKITTVILDEQDTYGEIWIDFFQWSSNENTVWISIGGVGESSIGFYSYNYDNGTLNKYDVPNNLGDNFNFNPDKGILVYTDYFSPIDAIGDTEADETLYLYNLITKIETKILTIKTKNGSLNPKWICIDYFDYFSESENKRIKRKI